MCVAPLRTKYRDVNNNFIDAPCGKCWQCLERRASGWAERIRIELNVCDSAHFVTLTYSDENVPYITNEWPIQTLVKRDLQLFFKRLRKMTRKKIIYYAVGEYGDQTERPHYHIILFNANPTIVDKAWTLGLTHYGKVEDGSIMYTLKYMQKREVPNYWTEGRQPKFALMSKGIGKGYLTEARIKWHKEDLMNRCYMPLRSGHKASLPRYLKDRIYTKKELQEIWKYHEGLEKTKIESNIESYYDEKQKEWRSNEERQRRFNRKSNRIGKL